ncbi:MAG TPA: putative maltokinase [Candidatus Acidoferrum sp.]|jgi:maltose alpha-D-glucosyltransferase/alpha-amylase
MASETLFMGNSFLADEDWYRELAESLPKELPAFLLRQRWYGAKARRLRSAELADAIPVHGTDLEGVVLVVRLVYADGPEGIYVIPALCEGSSNNSKANDSAWLRAATSSGVVLAFADALRDERFLKLLLGAFATESVFEGHQGSLRALQTTAYSRLAPASGDGLRPKVVRAEQSNSSIIYGDKLILKFFRRIEEGQNPDLEVGTFLTEKARFANIPQLAGSLEYRTRDGRTMAQGILQAFVANEGDAWSYTTKCVKEFYAGVGERSLAVVGDNGARRLAEPYLREAGLLGKRTAELHLALAPDGAAVDFAPEPFTMEFQRSMERLAEELTSQVFGVLRDKIAELPAEWRGRAEGISQREAEIVERFRGSLRSPIHGMRTRIHGDYHLGQVLYTGSDFVIIDFEGEPARPLAERRLKRLPLQDVAGMMRSFHYAVFAPLLGAVGGERMAAEKLTRMIEWAELWNRWVAARFLENYFAAVGRASFLPYSEEERQKLLQVHLLEKAVYELGYELNNRPLWVGIPLAGILGLLEG